MHVHRIILFRFTKNSEVPYNLLPMKLPTAVGFVRCFPLTIALFDEANGAL